MRTGGGGEGREGQPTGDSDGFASYFSRRQVGGRVEPRRRSLRLISLSNYVFVLEISQISGVVPNVSLLIRVVMRVCCGREERAGVKGEGGGGSGQEVEGGVAAGTGGARWPEPLHQ